MAARAAGALIGALILASRLSVRGFGRWIAISPAAFQSSLIVLPIRGGFG